MKKNSFLLFVLPGIFVLSLSFGDVFLPYWLKMLICSVSILLFFLYVISFFSNELQRIKEKSENENNELRQILSSISADAKTIMTNQTENAEGIRSALAASESAMKKDFGDRIDDMFLAESKEFTQLSLQNNDIKTVFKGLVSTQALTEILKKEIQNLGFSIDKNFRDNKDGYRQVIDEINRLNAVVRSLEKAGKTDAKNSPQQIGVNQDGEESFTDEVTKNKVVNKYVNGKLRKTTMKDTQGHLLYEMEYDSEGLLSISKSYDIAGNLTIEQVYYEDGQVHYRKEYSRKNGPVNVTEFDKQGNKK